MAHKTGAKVVWTLHDYKLICPSYSCLNTNGKVCEKCFSSKLPVLTTKCMKGSLAASAVAWLEAVKWRRKVLEDNVDCFICPSEFMNAKMQQGGFNSDKLVTLCNFVAPEMIDAYRKCDASQERDEYYCYVGRLSHKFTWAYKYICTFFQSSSVPCCSFFISNKRCQR